MKISKRTLRSGLALLPVAAIATPFVQTNVAKAECDPTLADPQIIDCITLDEDGYENTTGDNVTVNVASDATVWADESGRNIIVGDEWGNVVNNNGLLETEYDVEYATGVYSDGGKVTINNSGTFDIYGYYGAAGAYADSGKIVFNNAASGSVYVEVDEDEDEGYGVYGGGWYTEVNNAGLIDVEAEEYAAGVYGDGTTNVTNSGTINVYSDDDYADGIASEGKLTVANLAGGTINAYAEDDDATGIYGEGWKTTVNNAGTINAFAEEDNAYGIYTESYINIIKNTGTIKAGGIVNEDYYDYGPEEANGIYTEGFLFLKNEGSISATGEEVSVGVVGRGSTNIIINSGSIIGSTPDNEFAAGIDTWNGDECECEEEEEEFEESSITTQGGFGDFLFVYNTGNIAGFNSNGGYADGIYSDSNSMIINYGAIMADAGSTATGFHGEYGEQVIFNYGTISSKAWEYSTGVDASDSDGLYLVNVGTISATYKGSEELSITSAAVGSTADAVVGSDYSDYVYTNGNIQGNVILGEGNDDENSGDYMEVGGGAVNGMMDGGSVNGVDYNDDTPDGTVDELAFSINVDEKYYDQVMEEFESLNPLNDTITIQGNTYNFKNFEALVNAMKKEKTSFQDRRINPWDFNQTMTGWCVDGDNPGYSFWNVQSNSQGSPLGLVNTAQINAALEQAEASGVPVLIIEKDGKSVWALPSGELQLHDGSGNYDFVWSPDLCGSYTE